MARIEKTVFISYRRRDISWALAVYQYLKNHRYDVFFDYTSIPSGDFEQIIVSNIRARAHFVLILTPTALDRCNEPSDWLRREIETALDEKRNLIPLFFDGFSFGSPSVTDKLVGKLNAIKRYNGLDIPSGYFPEAMDRLSERYLNVPLEAVIHPVPTEVRQAVKEEKLAVDEALAQKWEEISELIKPAKRKTESLAHNQSEKPGFPISGSDKRRSFSPRSFAVGVVILLLVIVGIAYLSALVRKNRDSLPPTTTSAAATSTTNVPILVLPTNTVTVELQISTPTTQSTLTITPAPTLGIGSSMTSPKDGMVLVYVPAGEFAMGNTAEDALEDCRSTEKISNCDLDWFKHEEPPHTVDLPAFWIDLTEVTNAMYSACVQEDSCTEPSNKIYYRDPAFAHHPVVYVTWNDSNNYCSWAKRRLPTEAEWEKAASWDAERQIKNVYPWGDTIDCSFANYNEGSKQCRGITTTVRSYPKDVSPYGAFDMAGNVWEWVNDWYHEDYYKIVGQFSFDPPGPDGSLRVLRGGAWYSWDYDVRTAARYRSAPTYADDKIGFRCARNE